MSRSQEEKAHAFVNLHRAPGAFAIPNPWDIGSARILEAMGFSALATTSSGYAQTLGRADGRVSLDEKLQHCKALTDHTDVPISADLENGFGHLPEDVYECILRAADSGLVGASVEDYTGNAESPIYDAALAAERVAAAVQAAGELPFPFLVTARAENQLRAPDDLNETIARLQAYERAGADVLYAPGLKTLDEVRSVAQAIRRPLNVLGPPLVNCTLTDLAEAGAKRVSVGGAMARLVAQTLVDAGTALQSGSLSWASRAASTATVDALVRRPGD